MENKRGFKRKTIEKHIKEKIRDWTKTFKNDELEKKVLDSYILTGGAIASMLQGDLPNDYDIYFEDPQVAVDVANHYLEKIIKTDKVSRVEPRITGNRVEIMIKSMGVIGDDEGQNIDSYEYFESSSKENLDAFLNKWAFTPDKKRKYKPMMISSNAITLYDGIQIITRFTGNPETIHKNFDFIHCTNYFTEKTGLVLNQEALESILAKELRYVGSLYPITSLFRLRKFIKRGWSITAGEVLKISWDVSNLDLHDINVLRDQLTGVDAAYFMEMLQLIQKEGKPLDRTYLFEIVNRVFDDSEDLISSVSDDETLVLKEDTDY